MVSDMPIVNGEGPRDEPIPPIAVRNSKEPILSARFMAFIGAGLMRPLAPATTISERLEGGRGMAMLLLVPVPDVGVGICRLCVFVRFAEAGAEMLTSPNSEKISPRSAYLFELNISKNNNNK